MSPFAAQISYAAPPDAVAAMLSDRAFVERKVAASAPVSSRIEVSTRADGGFTVTTQRTLSTADLGARVQRLVGPTLTIDLIETWQAAQADSSRTGTVTLAVIGKPAKASGTAQLSPAGGGTTVQYRGSVEASIPLIGRLIEEQAVAQVQTVLQHEQAVGNAWLAEHG